MIQLGGIVSKVQERTTKTGKPFGIFSLEDFDGTLEMAMFGDEYLQYRSYLSPGQFLYIIGKVEERYKQPGLWEFRPKNIQLLEGIKENLTKEIQLRIELEGFSSYLVDSIENLCVEFPGKSQLKIKVHDRPENILVDTLSKKYLVSPDNHFFEKIEEFEGVEYDIVYERPKNGKNGSNGNGRNFKH